MTVPRRAASVPKLRLLWLAAALSLAVLLLLGAETWRAETNRELALPLGDRRASAPLLVGFHDPERDTRGRYRWTAGEAQALIAVPGAGRATILSLQLGPGVPGHQPPDLTLTTGTRPLVTLEGRAEPRRSILLVPPATTLAGHLELRLSSTTFSVTPDPRPLGVRVESMSARSLGAIVWPSPWPALLQTLILALVALTAIRLQAPGIGIVAVTVSAAVLLALAQSLAPAYTPLYLPRLVVAGLLLAGLSVLALPIMERKYAGAYAIWAVTVLACALRLAGALFPPFAAYDLGLNLGRLFATVNGTLVATNESFEFGGGLTVYPSGPYLVLMPGMLAGLTPKLAVQGGIALIDGLATLGVVALGHALGLRRQAVVFGALAYAAVPIGLTTLWYGHTAQAFGQALMAPLAAALLWGMRGCSNDRVHSTHSPTAPTTLWPWLIGGTLMATALLSHIGVTILALAWLGLLWLGVTLGRTLDRATWLRLTATFGFGGLAGLVFVYGPAALAHVEALRGLEFGGEGVAPKPSYNLIARAFWISYTPLGLLLAVAALPLARRRALPRGGGALLGAWVGAAALFCAVELVTGLQVRYLVFLTPLVCLAAGASLAWLAHRTPLGIWLAWVLALILVGQGAVVWLGGIFGPTAPSMVPLLR